MLLGQLNGKLSKSLYAERSLSASLKDMVTQLHEKDAALQRLAALHSRLLQTNDELTAELKRVGGGGQARTGGQASEEGSGGTVQLAPVDAFPPRALLLLPPPPPRH